MTEWPDYFCAPAFVCSAMRNYGYESDPIVIARVLNVKAPKEDNAYGLVEAQDENDIGVQFSEVKQLTTAFF